MTATRSQPAREIERSSERSQPFRLGLTRQFLKWSMRARPFHRPNVGWTLDCSLF